MKKKYWILFALLILIVIIILLSNFVIKPSSGETFVNSLEKFKKFKDFNSFTSTYSILIKANHQTQESICDIFFKENKYKTIFFTNSTRGITRQVIYVLPSGVFGCTSHECVKTLEVLSPLLEMKKIEESYANNKISNISFVKDEEITQRTCESYDFNIYAERASVCFDKDIGLMLYFSQTSQNGYVEMKVSNFQLDVEIEDSEFELPFTPNRTAYSISEYLPE